MPETAQEMETLRKELADVSTFVKERVEPVHDERVRLRQAIEALTTEQREYRRSGLLNGSAEARIVDSGPYAGCDELDLAILRSVQRAAETQLGAESVRDWDARIKSAMDSVTAGKGDELVPTGMASRLWDDVHQETRVGSLFHRIEMPTNPFDIPLNLGDVDWYPGSENTAVTASTPSTANQALTAHELVAEVPWSLTLDEDAVFAVLPEVRRTLVRNAAEVIDDVLLNADRTLTNNINADGATISATTAGKAHFLIGFNGLIHLPLVENTSQRTRGWQLNLERIIPWPAQEIGQVRVEPDGNRVRYGRCDVRRQFGNRCRRDRGQAGTEGDDSDRSAGVGLWSSRLW